MFFVYLVAVVLEQYPLGLGEVPVVEDAPAVHRPGRGPHLDLVHGVGRQVGQQEAGGGRAGGVPGPAG